MLKALVLSCFFASALSLSPTFAQTTPPPADQGGSPPSDQGAAPGGATGSKPSSKQLIASCRTDAQSKGLKGPELKASVHDCVAAQKPKVAARMQCHQEGKAQGKSGDDLKGFVKDCMANGRQ
jgi:hypothetical protein